MLSDKALAGVRLKIERAKKHIADLRAEVDPLVIVDLNSHPYRLFVEIDTKTGEQVVRVAEREPLKPELGAIAGDAVHNLRSALDLLMWQLVIAGGGTPDDHTMFPIGRSLDDYIAAKRARRIKGSAPSVEALLDTLKPYKGGNDTLWQIQRIDIVDKHHVLIPTASVVEAVFVPDGVDFGFDGTRTLLNLLPNAKRVPLEHGAELLRLHAPDPKVHVHPEAFCEVAFSEPEVVAGEPMLPTLGQLVNYTEGIVHAFAILP